RPGLFHPRSRALSGRDARVAAGRGRHLPRSGAPRHPEHRAAGPRRACGARLRDGGRLVSTARAARPGRLDRSRPPAPGPARPLRFPALAKSALANGLRVWTARHERVPIVSLMLLVRCGAAADPPGCPGLAAVTADMLDEGSGDRSAIEIHEA